MFKKKITMKKYDTITNKTRDDMAFFNSVLSYGIYTDREWMLGLQTFGNQHQKKSFEDVVTEAAFELFDTNVSPKELVKRNYELYISAYINDNFSKFSLNNNQEIDFISEQYGYKTKCQFEESNYFALNNLARAGYFLSKNEDGSKNLHLVFRGTDNKARDFMDFVGKAYLDMSAYYDAFKPLEEKILAFAKDPSNNIKNIHVSGHSLGGSMVQEFFNSPEVKASGINLVGFTYGAPGSDKKPIHSVVTESFHAVKKFFRTKKFAGFIDLAMNTITPAFSKLLPHTFALTNYISTTAIGFNFSSILPSNYSMARKVDNRIFQYAHSGDLIPKLGAAAYYEKGQEIYLKDVASKNIGDTFMLTGRKNSTKKHRFFTLLTDSFNFLINKPIQYVKNMLKFEYHDMMRYVVNLEHKIGLHYTKEDSPYYSQFLDYKERFTKNTTEPEGLIVYEKSIKSNGLSDTKMHYVRIPENLQSEINTFYYMQTSRNIVSDILGKNVAYNLKNFPRYSSPIESLKTTDGEILYELKTSSTIQPSEKSRDNMLNAMTLPIQRLQEMRKQFLENNKKDSNLTL